MLAAEKWYEYQEIYQKYGFDMKPKKPRKRIKQKKPMVTAKDKVRLLILTVFVGILCIGVIVTTAYAASIKYNINQVVAENAALEVEIENLKVKIYSSNNIEAIEKKATGKLGMVYPNAKHREYLNEKDQPPSDFAKKLKDKAYN